jgi:hypothetical protein
LTPRGRSAVLSVVCKFASTTRNAPDVQNIFSIGDLRVANGGNIRLAVAEIALTASCLRAAVQMLNVSYDLWHSSCQYLADPFPSLPPRSSYISRSIFLNAERLGESPSPSHSQTPEQNRDVAPFRHTTTIARRARAIVGRPSPRFSDRPGREGGRLPGASLLDLP